MARTKDSFMRAVKPILLEGEEIQWHSVHESFLSSLGRSVERAEMTPEAVLESLRSHFGYLLSKDQERKIKKALK